VKILVVEDNQNIQVFIKKGLQSESYAVDVASDGKEGFYLATTNSYDLIILDIMLPFMSGIELSKELRKYKLTTPILMLTAKDDIDDIVIGLDSGADDYMTKPFILKELLARIRALSRRSRTTLSTLSFKDLEIDIVKKKASRNGTGIELTSKEFAILELLVKSQNQVVSESMIIESVWDMNYSNASNLVKVYIYRLRNKVDKGFDEKYIHNIKNVGYIIK
jgi:DNA-binding response OmpR family regulator